MTTDYILNKARYAHQARVERLSADHRYPICPRCNKPIDCTDIDIDCSMNEDCGECKGGAQESSRLCSCWGLDRHKMLVWIIQEVPVKQIELEDSQQREAEQYAKIAELETYIKDLERKLRMKQHELTECQMNIQTLRRDRGMTYD